jgi:hypothetical protein
MSTELTHRERRTNCERLVLLLGVVAGLLVVVGLVVISNYETNFEDRYRQIQVGMSKEDVIRIMRCPPGDYRNPWHRGGPNVNISKAFPGPVLIWKDDRNAYWIVLDTMEKVCRCLLYPNDKEVMF